MKNLKYPKLFIKIATKKLITFLYIVKLIQYLFTSDGQKQKFLASGVPAQLNGNGRFFGNFEKELVKTPQDPIAPAAAKSRFLGALTGKTSKNLPEGNTKSDYCDLFNSQMYWMLVMSISFLDFRHDCISNVTV